MTDINIKTIKATWTLKKYFKLHIKCNKTINFWNHHPLDLSGNSRVLSAIKPNKIKYNKKVFRKMCAQYLFVYVY